MALIFAARIRIFAYSGYFLPRLAKMTVTAVHQFCRPAASVNTSQTSSSRVPLPLHRESQGYIASCRHTRHGTIGDMPIAPRTLRRMALAWQQCRPFIAIQHAHPFDQRAQFSFLSCLIAYIFPRCQRI